MREIEFRTWLKQQGYDDGTIVSRISNCIRVCEYEGDLDHEYATDKCGRLLAALAYSTEDERQNKRPKHRVPISGNVRNGTATLKNAVKLYIRFLEDGRISECEIILSPLPSSQKKHARGTTSRIADIELDSYSQFLDYFGIEKSSFYTFGLDNTIFADMEKAEGQWINLKSSLLDNQRIAIRGYGRQGANTELFLKLYEFLFKNCNIYEDKTNNAAPRRNIQVATGHRIGSTLLNYQCAHVFGHTKNPLLFEAVWNICFVPKLIDPLTGHEANGPWPSEYQILFRQMVYKHFAAFIDDYNAFVEKHEIIRRIQAFCDQQVTESDNKVLEKFRMDAFSEWEPICLNNNK